MKRKPLLLALFILTLTLFTSPPLFAQHSRDTLVRYFNSELEPVKKKDAVFVGVIIRDPFGWNCLVYDDSMRIIVRGKYADEECKTKQGYFVYYYADGKRASGGKYQNNVRTENWKTWHMNGQTKDSVHYYNGYLHGAAISYHEDGQVASEGIYSMGQMEGTWKFYHENGQQATREVYKNGKVDDLECFDTTGVSKGMNCALSRPPALVGRYGGIQKFLTDSLLPKVIVNAAKYNGVVTVEYTVTKYGELTNFRIVNASNRDLAEEVALAFAKMGKWYPAVSHNRNVTYTEMLNIPFFDRLEDIERSSPMDLSWDY